MGEFIDASNYLYAATSLFFFLAVISNFLIWTNLWSSKGYRLERVIIHCIETVEGRLLLFGWMSCIKMGAIGYYLISIVYEDILSIFPIIVFGIYFISALQLVWNLINKSISLPPITIKVICLGIIIAGLSVLLVNVPLLDNYFWLLIIEKVLTVVMIMYFILWAMMNDFSSDITINKAIKKRMEFKELVSIGVIGSYGKGETKEFIYSVLSKKYNILKTGRSKYAAVELADVIIKKLTRKKEIIVADLNYYRPGDLTEVTSIIKPQIVVLTAIGIQHVSAFKTEERILSEYENALKLIPRLGYVMYHNKDTSAKKVLVRLKKKKVSYALTHGIDSVHADIVAHDISLKPFHMSFKVSIQGKYLGHFIVHLVGEHVITHLLPAIYIGVKQGISVQEIKSAIAALVPLAHIMQPYITPSNVHIIDDTYHVNRESISTILSYIKNFKGRKIIVLQPIAELGNTSDQEHYSLAKDIAKYCDYLFVTNKNSIHSIQKGVRDAKTHCKLLTLPHKSIAEFVETQLRKRDVAVFLGKQSRISLNLISKELVQPVK